MVVPLKVGGFFQSASNAGIDLMLNTRDAFCGGSLASLASTVTSLSPAAIVAPPMMPLTGSSRRPGGSEPCVIYHFSGGVPPLARMCNVQGSSTTQESSAVVVISSCDGC